jgi:chemotaxis response regulator CheB
VTNVLGLRQLLKDPRLLAVLESNPNRTWSTHVAPVLLRVIQTKCPSVVTLDLSMNDIRTLTALKGIGAVAPRLSSIGLDGNNIKVR